MTPPIRRPIPSLWWESQHFKRQKFALYEEYGVPSEEGKIFPSQLSGCRSGRRPHNYEVSKRSESGDGFQYASVPCQSIISPGPYDTNDPYNKSRRSGHACHRKDVGPRRVFSYIGAVCGWVCKLGREEYEGATPGRAWRGSGERSKTSGGMDEVGVNGGTCGTEQCLHKEEMVKPVKERTGRRGG